MTKFEFYAVEMVSDFQNPRKLRFFGRDANRNKVVHTIEGNLPYFYILQSEESKINFLCKKEFGFKSIFGEDLIKVIVDNPWDIRTLAKNFEKTYEADIPYPTRHLIDNYMFNSAEIGSDNKLKWITDFYAQPRVCNIDIETDYSGGSNNTMAAPIIAIGFHDSYTNKMYSLSVSNSTETNFTEIQTPELDEKHPENTKFEVVEKHYINEIDLLIAFKQYVREMDFDIFVGWNVNFDMIYILHRMSQLNLKPEDLSPMNKINYATEHVNYGADKGKIYRSKEKRVMIRGRAIIDLLKGYKRIKWKQIESFRLEVIAQSEFKSKKLEYDGWISEFYRKDFKGFLRYNLRDIEISHAINRKYAIVDNLLSVRRMSGCELSDILFNSRIIDTYILRYCHGKFVLPTKKGKSEEEREDIEGGFVLDPVVGIHKNIVVLDLKGLYPNIMLAFNMSPETVDKNGDIHVGNGVSFRKELGISTKILLHISKMRDETRDLLKDPKINADEFQKTLLDRKQYYYKTFQNSFYGVTLYPGFRLFNPDIGSSITYVGRVLNEKMRKLCHELGYVVVAADTDSVMVRVNTDDTKEAVRIGKELEDKINGSFIDWFKETNCDAKYFSIKFEKLYSQFLIGSQKKMYAGEIVWDWEAKWYKAPKLQIKGFPTVKSDRSTFSRRLQKTIFELIFAGKTNEDILKYIYSEIDNFYAKKYPFLEIGIPKAITKDLEEYGTKNPWIEGVRFSLKNIKGYVFTPKPYLLYTTPTTLYSTTSFCFNNEHEVPKDLKIDMARMIETSITNVIARQIEILNIDPIPIETYISNKINNQKSLASFL